MSERASASSVHETIGLSIERSRTACDGREHGTERLVSMQSQTTAPRTPVFTVEPCLYGQRNLNGEVSYFARVTAGRRLVSPCVPTLEEAREHLAILRERATEIRRQHRELKARGKPIPALGIIYFIQSGDDGPIKIGRCKSGLAEKRLADLQIGNPVELSLLGTIIGDRTTEMSLHGRFARLRVRGEWFVNAPEIHEVLTGRPKWLRRSKTRPVMLVDIQSHSDQGANKVPANQRNSG